MVASAALRKLDATPTLIVGMPKLEIALVPKRGIGVQ